MDLCLSCPAAAHDFLIFLELLPKNHRLHPFLGVGNFSFPMIAAEGYHVSIRPAPLTLLVERGLMRLRFVFSSVVAMALAIAATVERPARAQEQAQQPGRKLALLVGVRQYRHSDLKDLEFPENDVEELASLLKQNGFAVTLLTSRAGQVDKDRQPDAATIRRQLSAILKDVSKKDLIIVGLAGHGVQPLESSQSYFCPSDANPSQRDGKLVKPETLLSIGEILTQLGDSGVGHKLLLVDACRNDPQVRGRRGVRGSTSPCCRNKQAFS
jgi:Caspase domain